MPALRDFLFSVTDVLLSSLLVAPLVVAYWRGTWQLVDEYLVPYVGDLLSAWISLAFGLIVHLVFALARPPPSQRPEPSSRSTLFIILSRLYTAIFGLACVNAWRGAWKVVDHYAGTSLTADACTTVIAVIALAMFRALRNISAPPFIVSVDSAQGYFSFPTALRTRATPEENGHQNSRKEHGYSPSFGNFVLSWWTALKYIMDCLFSVGVIGTLVVVVWRGAWNLTDHILFPERPDWSSWGSLVLGYCIVVLMFPLQVPMHALCKRLERGPLRLILANQFIFLSFCGTVNVWRGIWILLNIYLLPEDPLVSNWLTHVVCLLALMLLGCSNSILVRGVLLDGEEHGGDCVVFPVLYIRHYHRKALEERRCANLDAELQSARVGESAHPLVLANHHLTSNTVTLRYEEGGVMLPDSTTPLTLVTRGDACCSDTT